MYIYIYVYIYIKQVYQKVTLDKEAVIVMQINEVAKWSNRGNL